MPLYEAPQSEHENLDLMIHEPRRDFAKAFRDWTCEFSLLSRHFNDLALAALLP